MGSRMMMNSRPGADAVGIFPGLFVEPVATRWSIPQNHYDAGRQISIETETGRPAFQGGLSCGSTCHGKTETDSQMGINRGTDDSSTYEDTD